MNEPNANCLKTRGLLADCTAGEIDRENAPEIDEHLESCSACRKHAAELRATGKLLELAPDTKPSPGFDTRLAEKIQAVRLEQARQRVGLIGLIAVAARRVRRFGLGAAVYPLVALTMAYVAWAMVHHDAGPARPPVPVEFDSGIRLAHPRRLDRPAERDEPTELAHIDEPDFVDLMRESIPDLTELDFPLEDELLASRELEYPAPYMPRDADPEREVEELELEPDPQQPPIEYDDRPPVLPVGGPGGSALARARYTTIRNSRLRPVVWSGLLWLIRNQEEDGSWRAESGSDYSDIELTAAGALALMQAGYSPSGQSRAALRLRSALSWLTRQEQGDGTFGVTGKRRVHAQAMAVAALSEASRLTDGPAIRERFQPLVARCLDRLVEYQDRSGKWDDLETTTLALLATGAARAAGASVPAEHHRRALAWLSDYEPDYDSTVLVSRPGTTEPEEDISFVPIARVLAADRDLLGSAEAARATARRLATASVVWEHGDFFRWYTGTVAAYRLGGEPWQQWRARLLHELIAKGWHVDSREPGYRGSWLPHGDSTHAGRCYGTAMAVLSITATYGHSPVYGGTQ